MLTAWGKGDESALNALMPMVYQELRVVARKHLAGQPPGNSVESAAVVNEAYLKFLKADGIRCEGRLQFFALCAQIIRHILVDHARNRGYAKRGGGAVQIPFDEEHFGSNTSGVEVLDLDRALTSLSAVDLRKARVVELRHFGGLSVEETAEVLRISPETAKRDWKMAKAWLLRELTANRSGTSQNGRMG
ncbi:MAG: sigma-70 family RNA polymerase sigma factor [Acidobacteriia bacterium]|nr:sigma-70 family RNA polymerase sigma factor [Terriglobia bacterium]